MLSDTAIAALAAAGMIDPFDPARVQPASYDLRLGTDFLVPDVVRIPPGVTGALNQREHRWRRETGTIYLHPGMAVLGATAERVCIPHDIAARVEGRSTLGRTFVTVHVTAGFVDPGFTGNITLEIVNLGPFVVCLKPGMDIAQVNFTRLDAPAARAYGEAGNHYQGSKGVVAPWR